MKTLTLTRRGIALAVLSLLASAGVALAAYSYQCPRCGYVSTYAFPSPGARCPNDRTIMVMR